MNMKKFGPAILLALIVVAGVSGVAAFSFYQQLQEIKANPQSVVQEEADALIARVAKLIVLPEGEAPTIATVQDPEVLKEQPFFANAKRGDKVLIYTNAKKAILYDPVNNRIVEVAPVNIGTPQAPSQEEAPALAPTGGFEEEEPQR